MGVYLQWTSHIWGKGQTPSYASKPRRATCNCNTKNKIYALIKRADNLLYSHDLPA